VRPVLFRWRGHPVHAYTALLYLGLVAGVVAARGLAPRAGLDPLRVYVATLALVPPTLLGSRLLFVATHWSRYRHDRRAIWCRSEGGGALWGGLALSLLASAPIALVLGLPYGAFWDVTAVTMLIAMAFTRGGCVLHGCCPGRESRGWLALSLPGRDGLWRRRIPTQLLEAALALVVLAAALAAWDLLAGRGALFLAACGAYAAGRCGLETTREHIQRIGPLSMNQALSGLAILGALLALLALRAGGSLTG
jgi:phosphatidylglycerol:prolipoprotein diacylglycerol transferase